jgi:hypothetical protein
MTDTPPDGRRRLRWPWILVVVLLVGLTAAAWVGTRALAAKDHLDEARVQLEAARSALLDRRIPEARAAITAAGRETAAARSKTGDPVWSAAAAVPWAGNSLQVARGLAVGTDDTAREVLPPALTAAEGLDPKAARRENGSIDLALLAKVAPGVRQSADRAVAADTVLQGLDAGGLLAPVARARIEVLEASTDLRAALVGGADALEVAPALLGDDKPRRYLMIVQQTSESRGTGGLPGGFAEIVARGGALDVVSRGSNADLRNGPVALPSGLDPGFVARYRDLGLAELWQNVNVSPDLPNVAKVIETRWRAQGGAALDGVIMIDAKALAQILTGSGPLDVGGGRQIAPEGLEEYLAIGQYEGVALTDSQSVRKERLEFVAGEALERVTGGGGDSTALLRGLSKAVRSGHLRMASDDAVLQPTLARTGTDGSLPRGDAPVAYPVVFNATGGKLDYFLDREVSYEAGGCGGERRRSIIRTTLTSDVPITPLPPYLTIRLKDATNTQSRTNTVGLMVYGGRGSKLVAATVDGNPVSTQLGRSPVLLQAATEAGLPVWQVYLDLEPGKARTFAVELDEPTVAGAVRIPEQPLARPLTRATNAPICR